MDGMKIDFTDVEGQKTFNPIPSGKYIVEVTDYKEGEVAKAGENHGKPTVSWMLTVESLVNGDVTVVDRRSGEETKIEGRTVWENMTLTENSFWRLKAFLEACGFDVSGEIDFQPDEVLNSRLVIQVGIQPKRKDKDTGDEYAARNKIKSFHLLEEE